VFGFKSESRIYGVDFMDVKKVFIENVVSIIIIAIAMMIALLPVSIVVRIIAVACAIAVVMIRFPVEPILFGSAVMIFLALFTMPLLAFVITFALLISTFFYRTIPWTQSKINNMML
jgi:hypothetical protein